MTVPGSPNTSRRDAYLARMLGLVEEHGWAVQGVFPRAGHPEDGIPFSYTVGLTDRARPELLMVGLGHETAGSYLNAWAAHVLAGTVVPGTRYLDAAGPGLDLALVACPADQVEDMVVMPRDLYPLSDVEVWQIVWPDAANRMPWESGFHVVGAEGRRLVFGPDGTTVTAREPGGPPTVPPT